MAHFDVFNGDADGLCALHQLRLAEPRDATLVTGVKRDIALLERVAARPGDFITVLDVSLETNRAALLALLKRGAVVQYFDHHSCGQIPRHANLYAVIDPMPNVCTATLVDRYLGGIHRAWTVVAAFGDNMLQAAQELAVTLALGAEQLSALQELGECLNYKAYGDSEADLIVHPAYLYHLLHRHADPFSFLRVEPVLRRIRFQREHDLELARGVPPHAILPNGRIVVLPDAAWSRRVRGAYGNFLANAHPEEASAVLTPNSLSGYTVSVRAPLSTMRGAAQLCRLFATGGGREAAAGINHLPRTGAKAFFQAFSQAFYAN